MLGKKTSNNKFFKLGEIYIFKEDTYLIPLYHNNNTFVHHIVRLWTFDSKREYHFVSQEPKLLVVEIEGDKIIFYNIDDNCIVYSNEIFLHEYLEKIS